MFEQLSETLNNRLNSIDNKVQRIQNKTKDLEDKIDTILNHLASNQHEAILAKETSAVT